MSQVAKLKIKIQKYTNLVKLGCKKYIIPLLDAEAKLEALELDQPSKVTTGHWFTNALREIGVQDFDLTGNIKLVGVTDTVPECMCCGKKNLKRTAVLQDQNGNFSFYGSDCAYKALNVWGKSRQSSILRSAIKNAEINSDSNYIETTINGGSYIYYYSGNTQPRCVYLDKYRGQYTHPVSIKKRERWLNHGFLVYSITKSLESGNPIPYWKEVIKWYVKHFPDIADDYNLNKLV